MIGFKTIFDETKQDIELNTNTCRSCIHRHSVHYGASVYQYCSITSSNRTNNGLLKIKCKTLACYKYKKNIKIK